MKKITITNAQEAIDIGNKENPRLTNFEVEGPEEMEASDGYHTFNELYEHRITLFIALCRRIVLVDSKFPLMKVATNGSAHQIQKVWKSHLHSDGTVFEGWFVLGISIEKGSQITYHIPVERWVETDFAEALERAPEFDGHTSADVLERLKNL